MGETITFFFGGADADRAFGLAFGLGILAILGGLYFWCHFVDWVCKPK